MNDLHQPLDDHAKTYLQILGLQSVQQDWSLQERLDREAEQRLAAYRAALEEAATRHERVLHTALKAHEQVARDIADEHRLEAVLRKEAEDYARRQAELKSEIDRKRDELSARQRQDEAIAASIKAQLEAEESQQRVLAEERAVQGAAASKQQSQNVAPQQATQTNTAAAADPVVQSQSTQQLNTGTDDSPAQRHQMYLDVHQNLKTMRRNITKALQSSPKLKETVGDMRRQLKKSVGQLTQDPRSNMTPLRNIKATLYASRSLEGQPQYDARSLLVEQALKPTITDWMIPGAFLYLTNIFAKAVIAQFISEAGVVPKTADPIGIVAISIFANDDLRWQDVSLLDILLAKFHAVCPVLFVPEEGNEKTKLGREKLGWWKDPDTGGWVTEQTHAERMTGLAAGYAALSLRDFKQSKAVNPFPSHNFWSVLSDLLNLPSASISPTHCIVLKSLLEHHVPKFVHFYGTLAVAALRIAVHDFPQRAPQSVATSALATLYDQIRRQYNLTLQLSFYESR